MKRNHAIDVPLGKPLDLWKIVFQLLRQTCNHSGAPAFALLAFVDDAPDVLVETDELGVDIEHRAGLGCLDEAFDLGNQGRKVGADDSCLKSLLTRHTSAPLGWQRWRCRASWL
jgi:hypothetical protein